MDLMTTIKQYSDILKGYPLSVVVSLMGFVLLLYSRKTNLKFLKEAFYIPARKSTTDAVQLGGLPLSLGFLAGLFYFNFHPHFSHLFTVLDGYTLKYWLLASLVIVFYGYFDDRFELRPVIKLALQISCIVIFAVLESRVLFPKWSALSFVFLAIWGMGVLNGSNLLDGLDTLTVKLGLVTFLSYFYLGVIFESYSLILVSILALTSLTSFYFFNKEPARIHLGEIGGSFVGFIMLLCSCLLCSRMIDLKIAYGSSFFMSILPLSLPMVEIGVSFLRRLYNRRSPFKGDSYHLHHLLRNYYEFSPSTGSSLYALGYATHMALSLAVTHHVGPFWGFFCLVGTMTMNHFLIGKKHWHGDNVIELHPTALFDYLLKKDVSVIHSMEVDSFELKIIGVEEDTPFEDENTEEDLIDHSSSSDKKAA